MRQSKFYFTKALSIARSSNRKTVPIMVATTVVVVSLILVRVLSTSHVRNTNQTVEAYQAQLLNQVDTENGDPRSGRDPSTQQQTSLASAASNPAGVGLDNQSGATSDNQNDQSQSGANGDPNQSGIGSNGCYIDYGIQGEQCLPAHAAGSGTLTCSGVHSHGFPSGIRVSGTDRFNLDTNKDGIACGSGE